MSRAVYVANVLARIGLVASSDVGAKSRQMLPLLDDVAALSDKVTALRADDDPRRPSFLIRRTGTDAAARCAGGPMGLYLINISQPTRPD